MEYRTTVTYTPDMLAYSARRAAIEQIQWRGFLGFGLLIVVTIALYVQGRVPWLVGACVAVLCFAAFVGISSFIIPYRRSKSVFDKLGSKTGEFWFSEDGWGSRSDLGTQQVSWTTIEAVIRDPRVWLLKLHAGAGYVTLPTASLDARTQSFVAEQVLRHGGKVSGSE